MGTLEDVACERYFTPPMELKDCLLTDKEISEATEVRTADADGLIILSTGYLTGRKQVAQEQLNSPKLQQYIQEQVDAAVKTAFEAGIKVAMDWAHTPCPHTGGLEEEQMYAEACPKCYKELLKKWGIKE